MQSIQLPIHSYNQPSRASARLVNCYAQQSLGKGPVDLLGAPGIVPHSTPGDGPGRGLFVMRGVLYAVSGTNLYKIDEDGSETLLGTLPGTGKLQFAGNGTEIVFSNRYILSGGTVSAISDPDLPAVAAIGYVDGYVVYAETGSQRWGCSDLYAGSTYSSLDWKQADAYPDDLVTLAVDHRQVVLFGQESTELWYNTGPQSDADLFPFQRLSGGFLEYGCLARLGVCKQDNSVFWLANDRTVRRLSGQTPVRVSHHGMEEALAGYSRVDDCEAFAYTWCGHLFCVFKFPTAGACWVFDVTAGEWHERETYGKTGWNVCDAVACYGRVYMQNAETGDVGYLSNDYYQEFGGILRRSWTYPQVYDTNRPITHSAIVLVAKTGTAPIGIVPSVLLEISDDGGNTWKSLPSRELGRTGEYANVIRWNRLGQARDRVYRMSLDNTAVPLCITDTTLSIE